MAPTIAPPKPASRANREVLGRQPGSSPSPRRGAGASSGADCNGGGIEAASLDIPTEGTRRGLGGEQSVQGARSPARRAGTARAVAGDEHRRDARGARAADVGLEVVADVQRVLGARAERRQRLREDRGVGLGRARGGRDDDRVDAARAGRCARARRAARRPSWTRRRGGRRARAGRPAPRAPPGRAGSGSRPAAPSSARSTGSAAAARRRSRPRSAAAGPRGCARRPRCRARRGRARSRRGQRAARRAARRTTPRARQLADQVRRGVLELDERAHRVEQDRGHATQCQVANCALKAISSAPPAPSTAARRARPPRASHQPAHMNSGKSTSSKRGSDISGCGATG